MSDCIKEVEKFILKNISKFDPDMLTDATNMWHAIGGDPELPMNYDEMYKEVCSRG